MRSGTSALKTEAPRDTLRQAQCGAGARLPKRVFGEFPAAGREIFIFQNKFCLTFRMYYVILV